MDTTDVLHCQLRFLVRTYFTFMLPCIVIDFFLNNQPHALIIQIYSVIKLYMFRASFNPSSEVSHCIFGTGKFHAGFDDRFQAELGWNCMAVPS